ncbi:MAG: NAD(P)H-hydrate dehydratase [Eubacteriales bacterium]|nr:NAD(P)H-hydrate dehydratase [Eubacteriales bacterium]
MKMVLSPENMHLSERTACEEGVSPEELMGRAAEAIVDRMPPCGSVLIITGSGNNAGDGYAAALILDDRGVFCDILRLTDKTTDAGEYYLSQCRKRNIRISTYSDSFRFSGYDVILDCLFGIGFSGELTGDNLSAVNKINASGAYVVCADINSGLNASNGLGKETVKSDLTVAVGFLKPGHILNDAADKIGRIEVCDIGLKPHDPYFLLEEGDMKVVFPDRKHNTNKGTYGTAVLFGGRMEYSGAARIARMGAAAALAGSGLVRLAVPENIAGAVASGLPESTLFLMDEKHGSMTFDRERIGGALKGASSVAVGFGWGRGEDYRRILEEIIRNYDIPTVIDADGLNTLAESDTDILKVRRNIVLTPHPGEFARLTGRSIPEVLADPIGLSVSFAREYRVTVLLKGTSTVITDGERVYLTSSGSPGMAKGGSGDALTGLIAGILAQNRVNGGDITLKAAAGAFIAGKAGEAAAREKGEVSALAGDTIRHIPEVIKKIYEKKYKIMNKAKEKK